MVKKNLSKHEKKNANGKKFCWNIKKNVND